MIPKAEYSATLALSAIIGTRINTIVVTTIAVFEYFCSARNLRSRLILYVPTTPQMTIAISSGEMTVT